MLVSSVLMLAACGPKLAIKNDLDNLAALGYSKLEISVDWSRWDVSRLEYRQISEYKGVNPGLVHSYREVYVVNGIPTTNIYPEFRFRDKNNMEISFQNGKNYVMNLSDQTVE